MFDQIRIVLVNTTHPGNIGAAARAMKNMGLSQLVLVEPKRYPDPEAEARSSGATDILANARCVATLEEAVADCALVIGTSARSRKLAWTMLDPKECAQKVLAEAPRHPVALVFGREDRGLTNEELQRCQFHVHIPSNPEFSSLNLGAAVQVLCYELRMAYLGGVPDSFHADEPLATGAELEQYFKHLEAMLRQIEFIKDEQMTTSVMARMRRLYSRMRPEQNEVRMLHGVLSETERQLDQAGKRGN